MISLRNRCTGRWPVHSYKKRGGLVAGLMLGACAALAPTTASAETAVGTPAVSTPVVRTPVVQSAVGQSVADFYKARKDAPLWLSPEAGDSAQKLVALLNSSGVDGLNPNKYYTSDLQEEIERAQAKRKRKDIERADQALSNAFVAYVDDLRQDPGVGITWVDPSLKPTPPSPLAALIEAAETPSLANYVVNMGWMHPFYGELRDAILQHKYSDDHQREILELNLRRARILPASKDRYVLVNAAQQRLFMYRGRQARRQHGRGRRQDQMADADARRLHPLCSS